jgi:hypothetical protein
MVLPGGGSSLQGFQSGVFSTARPYWYESVETIPGESAPAGAQLEISMDGGASVNDTSQVCQVLVQVQAVGKSLQAQFAVPGIDQRVTVFSGLTVVYSGTSPGQPFVTFAYWPQRVRQELVAGLPEQEVQFDTPSLVTVNGVPVGGGDRIVIDPEGPGLPPITTFSRHRVRIMGLDGVRVKLLLPSQIVATAGSGQFGGVSSFDAGAGPLSVAIADLNADGNPDVVLANSNANTVSVLHGDGAGGFGPKSDLPTGAQPWSVAVGDVTGDGLPDLVVADHAAAKISVLAGNSAGGFGGAVDYATAPLPSAVAIVDVNGDGRADVLATCAGVPGSVSVLLADGAGGLGPRTDYPTGGAPFAIAVGWVNGDGRPDIVVANSASNTISLLTGDGHGGFGPKTDFAVGSEPRSVALADLNRDGLPDLVTADHTGGTISVRKGVGPGSFGPVTSFPVGGAPLNLAVVDLNGDDLPDVAVADPTAGTVSVLYGNGMGGFVSTSTLVSGAHPNAVALGDISRDGIPDLVIADGVTSNDAAGYAKIVLGVGGSIVPPGTLDIAGGTDAPYSVYSSSGYAIANVMIDGTDYGSIPSWLFSSVSRPHTITARFDTFAGVGSPTATPPTARVEVQPNPTDGTHLDVQFSLPSAAPTGLELVDVGGRQILRQDVGSLGPGDHTISLSLPRRLAPGLYWVRLSHGGTRQTAKLLVIE